jgi:DNA polymerase IV
MRLARICCLDLDTFFVSVERRLDPTLEGRPVIVGGRKGGRGVVTSASYDVRALGVRSGMSIREASDLAPHAVFLPGHHEAYVTYSRDARAIVERYSPVVRAASIDEQYIDFHGCERLYRRPGDPDDDATIFRVVREITGAIAGELGLPSSAGIATSISMAKVACGLAKPRGVRLVAAGEEAATLAPLPVRKLPGIGPVAEAKLARLGIARLGELAGTDDVLLRPILGSATGSLRRAAVGLGDSVLGRERPAFREHDPRGEVGGSISNERTFVETSARVTDAILCGLCERVCFRARSRGVTAGQVALKLRYTDFQTLMRSRSIEPTTSEVTVHRVVMELHRQARTRELPVRLLGVALSKLRLDDGQLGLFDAEARRAAAVDRVRAKFGYDAVSLATTRFKR